MNKYFVVMLLMSGSFIAGVRYNNNAVHADNKHVSVKYMGDNPLTPEQFNTLYALQEKANADNHVANKAAMDALFDQVEHMDRNQQLKAMHMYYAAQAKHKL